MSMDPTSADYYVNLDSKGKIIVRSPHAQHHLHKHGTKHLRHINDQDPISDHDLTYLTPGRRIGQGDVTSAIFWLLVFDILLTSLDIAIDNPSQPDHNMHLLRPHKTHLKH